MLDRRSQLANAVLLFVLGNRGIRCPILMYNEFARRDTRDYGMSREAKGRLALAVIEHCLRKTEKDLAVLRDIEIKHGTLHFYGPSSGETEKLLAG